MIILRAIVPIQPGIDAVHYVEWGYEEIRQQQNKSHQKKSAFGRLLPVDMLTILHVRHYCSKDSPCVICRPRFLDKPGRFAGSEA